jgi:hypothetical protein
MPLLQTLFYTLVLTASVLLLQYHAWDFWRTYTSYAVGPYWAITLEVYSFFFWFDKSKNVRYGLGIITTLLLMLGPLYMVAKPVLNDTAQASVSADSRQAIRDSLTTEIAQLEASVVRYHAEKALRAARLTEERLSAKQAEYRAELARESDNSTQVKAGLTWQGYVAVAMQALGVIVLQFGAILCIRRLREAVPERSKPVVLAKVEETYAKPPKKPIMKPTLSVEPKTPEKNEDISQLFS